MKTLITLITVSLALTGCAGAPRSIDPINGEIVISNNALPKGYRLVRKAAGYGQTAVLYVRSTEVESVLRPVSYATSLGSLVLKSAVGAMGRVALSTTLMPALDGDIPPVSNAESMDLVAWEAQLESPEDYSFDSTVAARLHVKRAPTGHILVKPVVDQKEVGWFIFDTGAGASAIDTALALELGLKPSGSLRVGGIGGDVETSVFRAASFHLGPLTVQNSFLIGTDLKPISQLLGTEIAGIIGYNVLARSVIEFNRLDAKVALFDPDRYERKDLEWSTLILYNRIAHLRGSLEGHEGVFVLDTGSGGSLIVHQPAVAGLKLLSGRATQPTTLRGIGGTLPALQGSVSKLNFAGFAWASPNSSV